MTRCHVENLMDWNWTPEFTIYIIILLISPHQSLFKKIFSMIVRIHGNFDWYEAICLRRLQDRGPGSLLKCPSSDHKPPQGDHNQSQNLHPLGNLTLEPIERWQHWLISIHWIFSAPSKYYLITRQYTRMLKLTTLTAINSPSEQAQEFEYANIARVAQVCQTVVFAKV